MVGGIKDWSYTIELQDRGSPHVHMVLWTGKSSDELLQHPSLVSAQIPNQRDDPDLYALVTQLQIHNCGNYCRREDNDPNHPCRFGFPHRAQPVAMFDPVSNRSIYLMSLQQADSSHIRNQINWWSSDTLCEEGNNHSKQRLWFAIGWLYYCHTVSFRKFCNLSGFNQRWLWTSRTL